MSQLSRRGALLGASAAALGLPSIVYGAPEYRLKLANIMPTDHPLNTQLQAASQRISEETNGRVDIAVFPANQLGTDSDMLSQLRSGAIDFFPQSGLIVATLVPIASITGVGFAFTDYPQVWKAVDGALGKLIIAGFEKANLRVFDRMWDNGFRQTTSSTKPIKTPDDFKGFKIRVPPSPLWTSLFKSLGAAPTSIPWGETYSALQTHVADGLENPVAGIYFAKMYEVQKYLSRTNHMWDGFWMLVNRKNFEAMPADTQETVERILNEAALKQRADVEDLNRKLLADLTRSLQLVEVDPTLFRQKLQGSDFYSEWKKRFGDEAWAVLEAASGRLA